MSCVKIILHLLNANPSMLAAVPTGKIFAGVIPQGTPLPAVSVMEVSTVEQGHIDAQAPTTIVDSRAQVTVVADTYSAQKHVLDLVRKACNYERGLIKGLQVISVRRLANGPDFNDPDAGFYTQSVDFMVTYHEPN